MIKFPLRLIVFLILFTISGYSKTFSIDKAHSYVGFKVKYLTLSTVQGRFDSFNGNVQFVDNKINSINGQIDVASIDTKNAKRDQHLKSSDFFNQELYPEITYQTTQISKVDDQYIAVGELEIHGIKRVVSIPFTVTDPLVEPNGVERMGLTGSITINRKKFGLSYSKKLDNGGLVVDDYVDIDLVIHLVSQPDDASTI